MHKLERPSKLFCSLLDAFGCAATLTPGIPVPSSALLWDGSAAWSLKWFRNK